MTELIVCLRVPLVLILLMLSVTGFCGPDLTICSLTHPIFENEMMSWSPLHKKIKMSKYESCDHLSAMVAL